MRRMAALNRPAAPVGGRARRRLPALDGLRGIGIAAVVVYHLDPAWLPGGYLGVDVFFVVSGFLITGLLLDLLGPAPSPWPALRTFWARRARRLLPALVVLAVVLSLVAGLIARDAVPRLRADIPAALAFIANWQLLFHHDSYFESMGRPPLLLHLWSLGVEEQFYLVWPLVVLGAVHACQRPVRALCWMAGTGAACSALLMAALYVPGHDPSAVYYDTFTHSAGLMIGAALAAATYKRRLAPAAYGARPRAVIGVAALAGLGVLLAVLGSGDTFTYRGGILIASALTGLVIIVAVRPGVVSRLLSFRPLRYLGAPVLLPVPVALADHLPDPARHRRAPFGPAFALAAPGPGPAGRGGVVPDDRATVPDGPRSGRPPLVAPGRAPGRGGLSRSMRRDRAGRPGRLQPAGPARRSGRRLHARGPGGALGGPRSRPPRP